MNARSNLITALLTLSLIVPSAAGAVRGSIPADALPSKQSKVHLHTLKANSSTVGLDAYNASPYVYGGASQKVAKAITAAAKPRVATRTASTCVSDAQYRVPC
jgi:hypothetical protein